MPPPQSIPTLAHSGDQTAEILVWTSQQHVLPMAKIQSLKVASVSVRLQGQRMFHVQPRPAFKEASYGEQYGDSSGD